MLTRISMTFVHLPEESNLYPYHFTAGNFLFKNETNGVLCNERAYIKNTNYFTGHKWASTVDAPLDISL